MRKRGFIIAALLCGFVSLIAALPLAWIGAWIAPRVLPENLSAQLSYDGTLWQGSVRGVPNADRLTINTSLRRLVTGQSPLLFTTQSVGVTSSGQIRLSGLRSVIIKGQVARLLYDDARFIGVSGDVSVSLVRLDMNKGGCSFADGQVETDVLSRNQALWQWQGPNLSGPITCDNGALVITLSGQDQAQTLSAIIRLDKTGQYQSDVTLKTQDDDAVFILPLLGFEDTPEGFKITERGSWL